MTDLITRAVVERAVMDRLSSLHLETKAALDDELKVTERRPVEIDGDLVGVVQKKRGAHSASVKNREALTQWALKHRPDEVEEVVTYRLRPATEAAWLAALKAGGTVVSETTGEVMPELPGIVVATAAPTLSIVPEKTPEVAALVTAVLVGAGLLELEP